MSGLQADIHFDRGAFALRVALDLPAAGVTAILGPSGCGKTTLLRLLAGLEKPTGGKTVCGGQIWSDADHWVKPQERRVGMLFQDYALFPHLTARANVAFGLTGEDRWQRADACLQRLHAQHLAPCYPARLSGGERQRVALARALAIEPSLILLDEPLSAIDHHLRRRLREHLRADLAGSPVPVIIVTHDLEEARVLADRIGVMVDGRLWQLGAPRTVFEMPVSRRVAEVLGWRNFLPVTRWSDGKAAGSWGQLPFAGTVPADAAWLGIRPGHLVVSQEPTPNSLKANLVLVSDLGDRYESLWQLESLRLVAQHREPVAAEQAYLTIPSEGLLPIPD